MGRTKTFSFDMETTLFELELSIISLQGSRLWQQTHSGASEILKEGWTLIYLPFVHYLKTIAGNQGKSRVIGEPDETPWKDGVPSVIDIKVLEMTEGRLEIQGQWCKWYYPLHLDGDRDLRLRLQRWV
jgi:hypothetical protein